MSLLDAYKASVSIEGWLSRQEGILLWSLARSGIGTGSIIEVGSWKGKSTVWLAYGTKSAQRERVVAIDPHSGSKEHQDSYGRVNTFDDFIRNLRLSKLERWVHPVVASSRDVASKWKGDVRLVFIDGSHEYEDVKDDFTLWFDMIHMWPWRASLLC